MKKVLLILFTLLSFKTTADIGGFAAAGIMSSPSLMGSFRLRLSAWELGLTTLGFADEQSVGAVYFKQASSNHFVLGPIYHFAGGPGLYGGIGWSFTATRLEFFSVVAAKGIVRPGIMFGVSY